MGRWAGEEGSGIGKWTAGMGALLEVPTAGPPSPTTTISSSPAPCRKQKKRRVKTSTTKLSHGHRIFENNQRNSQTDRTASVDHEINK
jgi:hypothetical protein